ncbi:protein kinase [Exophiala dermatitidis]|uniref:Protein kinase n=1 Tax=Exophiala dermatitidis TaxID=5970 RepID=A0AAN6ESV9_EXODE|nr:protein kinase [Exophiala dermatitidis]KAJ4517777.1 protein kinase [Exophiala dermatitidis]KAJ4521440.1 protein kinase [Exophiala dermatitidis]KAJ4542114.1 protein kinase [Exophiala dermatitidis]KAJ4544879.1 protein kinase [Exophiala dermatitidis]
MAVPTAADNDLINFDIIETHKENIQSLPGGRSAKQLASILSPLPSGRAKGGDAPATLEETKTLNDAIRQEYEIELQSIADSDDPLDIYDRYVKWTLNAYPSAQATPQSQLLPLLERATKAFLTSPHYKNDPRYLKLWLHYIRLFSDSPRETFAFLSRHGIGEGLGLFYEEFAAWLESAGRWIQADEVYKLGIEREARPTERLLRKYGQFQQRFEARPHTDNEPSSPALPTVRPALAAKIDPFATSHRNDEAQAARQHSGTRSGSGATSRSGKPKMAIFSDAESATPAPASSSGTTKGWDSIGSMKERKKENTIEARPWAGEKLKAGGKVGTVPKMEIFKDPSQERQLSKQRHEVVNPRTGRAEQVYVDIDAIYPPHSEEEFSFEELRARSRGWAQKNWKVAKPTLQHSTSPLRCTSGNVVAPASVDKKSRPATQVEPEDVENLSQSLQQKMDLNDDIPNHNIHDVSTQSMVGMPETHIPSQPQTQSRKEKRPKVREIKQETMTVKTRLESPTGKKLKRKNSSTTEPTMTFHSKAATNEIYDMFNQPLRRQDPARDDTQSGDDTEYTEGDGDDGYSTTGDGESTGTGRVFEQGSEFGDDTSSSLRPDTTGTHSQDQSQPDSVSPWSDFTVSKHVPRPGKKIGSGPRTLSKGQGKTKPKGRLGREMSEDMTESMGSSSQNPTQTSGFDGLDTQAIAAIAGANFEDMDTKAIAMLAGDVDQLEIDDGKQEPISKEQSEELVQAEQGAGADENEWSETDQPGPVSKGDDNNNTSQNDNSTTTPVDDIFTEISHKPRFIPIPPEDYEPTPVRPYRDPVLVAQNKLPFMTPIVERTESSLAPLTAYRDSDYFNHKTPSRSPKGEFDSPLPLTADNLLMSSPQEPSPSTSVKRKHSERYGEDVENRAESPEPKKPFHREEKQEKELDKESKIAPTHALETTEPAKTDEPVFKTPAVPSKSPAPAQRVVQPAKISKGPIVADLQCNPCDDAVRQQILTTIHPPLSSYSGYHDHSEQTYNHYQTLKVFGEKMVKSKVKASPRKSQGEKGASKAVPPMLKFKGTTRVYAVKRQLGEGAFAPVYLVDSYDPNETAVDDGSEDKENGSKLGTKESNRQALEALKTEAPPGTLVWEFHILRLVRHRLGPAARTMQSIVCAHECHLYRDEAYILLSYSPQGTLLDLVNLARSESIKAGKPAEGLDEPLAMWFGVELLRILEDLHRIGILHGDLKGDNCLVRFEPNVEITVPFDPEGNHGWSAKGLKLIDFGRGIDVRMFKPNAQFIADWPSCPQDCAEIRECRPWKWQIDYHGMAGIIHSLLFGKYIETVPVATAGLALGPGQKKEWKLKENLKRYWEKEIWQEVFTVLLNPGSVADKEEMPIQNNLKRVRVKMEKWLVQEGERGGRDLRGSLRKMERLVVGK